MRVVLRPGRTGTRENKAANAGQSHVGQERPTRLWLRSVEAWRCIDRCQEQLSAAPGTKFSYASSSSTPAHSAKGDSAEIAQVELVGSEFNPRAQAEADAAQGEAAPKPKGVGGRIRAAASRLRSGNKPEGGDQPKAKASKPAKGAARKSTT